MVFTYYKRPSAHTVNYGATLTGSTVITRLGPCKIGLSNLYVTESGATPNVSATIICSTYQVRPSIWAFVMLEPLARKLAYSVLREEGGREAPDLPGGLRSK